MEAFGSRIGDGVDVLVVIGRALKIGDTPKSISWLDWTFKICFCDISWWKGLGWSCGNVEVSFVSSAESSSWIVSAFCLETGILSPAITETCDFSSEVDSSRLSWLNTFWASKRLLFRRSLAFRPLCRFKEMSECSPVGALKEKESTLKFTLIAPFSCVSRVRCGWRPLVYKELNSTFHNLQRVSHGEKFWVLN